MGRAAGVWVALCGVHCALCCVRLQHHRGLKLGCVGALKGPQREGSALGLCVVLCPMLCQGLGLCCAVHWAAHQGYTMHWSCSIHWSHALGLCCAVGPCTVAMPCSGTTHQGCSAQLDRALGLQSVLQLRSVAVLCTGTCIGALLCTEAMHQEHTTQWGCTAEPCHAMRPHSGAVASTGTVHRCCKMHRGLAMDRAMQLLCALGLHGSHATGLC